MNFDYKNLKKYTTDELYNTYESDLKILSIKNQKNIIKDIIIKNVKIINIKIQNNIEIISDYLIVQMYDYVTNSLEEIVTKGLTPLPIGYAKYEHSPLPNAHSIPSLVM